MANDGLNIVLTLRHLNNNGFMQIAAKETEGLRNKRFAFFCLGFGEEEKNLCKSDRLHLSIFDDFKYCYVSGVE